MFDFLITLYPWIKSLHIIAVISWMAGLFYLPRLFVHHTESVEPKSNTDFLFRKMERKLMSIIMYPAMFVAWVCGILLAITPGLIDFGMFWPWIKFISVLLMTGFHLWLSNRLKLFERGENSMTGKSYRIMNEVPTVLLLIIIISVIVRPF